MEISGEVAGEEADEDLDEESRAELLHHLLLVHEEVHHVLRAEYAEEVGLKRAGSVRSLLLLPLTRTLWSSSWSASRRRSTIGSSWASFRERSQSASRVLTLYLCASLVTPITVFAESGMDKLWVQPA